MTPQDRAIVATLTGWPVYVPKWDEYAAFDLNGDLHTADSFDLCMAAVKEANELIARHRAAQVAAGWAEYEQAAEKARADVDAWLVEIKENQK